MRELNIQVVEQGVHSDCPGVVRGGDEQSPHQVLSCV